MQSRDVATAGALAGVRVLDLSEGIAGPFAARLLGDFGAEVIKIERPGTGDPARRAPPSARAEADHEGSLLFQYLNWNKRGMILDLACASAQETLRDLVSRADVLIEAFQPGTLAAWGLEVDRLHSWNPRLVVTSVTDFGQTGPYAGFAASDLVLQAMSGIMQISGSVDREPLKHGLAQSYYCGGLNAAYATIAAYLAALRDGVGEHVDLSIHECLASELVFNQSFYAFLGAVQGRRAAVQDPFDGEPLPTRSGYLSVQAGGGAPFEDFADLFGQPALRSPDYASPAQRVAHAPGLRAMLQERLEEADAKAWFLEGSRRRLLLGVAQSARDLLRCEHLRARQFFQQVDHPATGSHAFPAELVKLSMTPMRITRRAPLLGEHTDEVQRATRASRPQDTAVEQAAPAAPWPAAHGPAARAEARLPLQGVRVLDLSYVFAVPYIGALMADLGAEVIKVEGPHRLDLTRGTAFARYADNEPGDQPWNRSGVFHVLNRGKKAVCIDLTEREGRELLRDLTRRSDVVLENFTPRVLRNWGLDYAALSKVNPALVMLSNTGYGAGGPWSEFPSQGTTLEATMGISHYTGYTGDKPWKVGQSYPDFLATWTGLMAVLAALVHSRRCGKGQWIDLGMYQVGAAMVVQPLLMEQLGHEIEPRMGNADAWAVPSNLYPALGKDAWIALTVSTDEQWSALTALMGQPHLASDTRFATREARLVHRELVDEAVSQWTRHGAPEQLTQLLQSQGIAAGPVLNSRDLAHDSHLRARQFYETVDHEDGIGPRALIGRPFRLRHRDARVRRRAPRFAEHNTEVLGNLLGLPARQLDELAARGVLESKPRDPGRARPWNLVESLRNRTIVAVDPDYRTSADLGTEPAGLAAPHKGHPQTVDKA